AFSLPLESTRAGTTVTGSVQLKVGFVRPPAPGEEMSFEEIYKRLLKSSDVAPPVCVSLCV
ncbi:hypothetical protein H0H87_005502, partial [Tephrocybe sp. NHM501043]